MTNEKLIEILKTMPPEGRVCIGYEGIVTEVEEVRVLGAEAGPLNGRIIIFGKD